MSQNSLSIVEDKLSFVFYRFQLVVSNLGLHYSGFLQHNVLVQ